MNNVENDAYRLCKIILSDTEPSKSWKVVNIAIHSNDRFTFTGKSEIPTSYGYVCEDTPEYLIRLGIIALKSSDKWFSKIQIQDPNMKYIDLLTEYLRKVEAIRNFQYVSYYYSANKSNYPQMRGQSATIIDIQRLREYVGYFDTSTPQFDFETGTFSFLNEKIQIEGRLQKLTIQALVKNFNSIIPKEDFFIIRNPDSKTTYKAECSTLIKKKATDNALEKGFKEVSKKIKDKVRFKSTLVFVQNAGFGLFLDRNSYSKILREF